MYRVRQGLNGRRRGGRVPGETRKAAARCWMRTADLNESGDGKWVWEVGNGEWGNGEDDEHGIMTHLPAMTLAENCKAFVSPAAMRLSNRCFR